MSMKIFKDKKESSHFKNLLQSCNINFLIGSGASSPFLETLNQIENYLTEASEIDDEEERDNLEAILYKNYFKKCIDKNIDVLKEYRAGSLNNDVIGSYVSLYSSLNQLIALRQNNLISKQINLFTTNIDIFNEIALESLAFEINDGFSGSLIPTFSSSNFKKIISRASSYYGVVSELPVFNLIKLHGSITWKIKKSHIRKDSYLSICKEIRELIAGEAIQDIGAMTLEQIREELIFEDDIDSTEFLKKFKSLPLINPNKVKFETVTLNSTYYELLRIFSNDLEKENSALFVMGFSFADEHIRDLVRRSVQSNPTLTVYIFGYTSEAEDEIRGNLGGATMPVNIEFIPRPGLEFKYDLEGINQFFKEIIETIKTPYGRED